MPEARPAERYCDRAVLITRSVPNHVALEGYIGWQSLVVVQGKYVKHRA